MRQHAGKEKYADKCHKSVSRKKENLNNFSMHNEMYLGGFQTFDKKKKTI